MYNPHADVLTVAPAASYFVFDSSMLRVTESRPRLELVQVHTGSPTRLCHRKDPDGLLVLLFFFRGQRLILQLTVDGTKRSVHAPIFSPGSHTTFRNEYEPPVSSFEKLQQRNHRVECLPSSTSDPPYGLDCIFVFYIFRHSIVKTAE